MYLKSFSSFVMIYFFFLCGIRQEKWGNSRMDKPIHLWSEQIRENESRKRKRLGSTRPRYERQKQPTVRSWSLDTESLQQKLGEVFQHGMKYSLCLLLLKAYFVSVIFWGCSLVSLVSITVLSLFSRNLFQHWRQKWWTKQSCLSSPLIWI